FVSNSKNLIGIRLTDTVNSIDSFVFNTSILGSSNSCSIPLRVDILNDQSFEFSSEEVSDELCASATPYGCYNEGDSSSDKSFLITENAYCSKVNISSGKKFKIGADILEETGKGGEVYFRMEIRLGLESQECIAKANASGSISCITDELSSGILEQTNAEICISVDDEEDSGKYKIKYETVNPCGSAGTGKYDFPIFVYAFKYSKVDNFVFNQELIDDEGNGIDLSEKLSEYISDKYDGECDPECVIPIGFYSGQTQDVIISDLEMIYTADGSKPETNIYNINETGALVNSGFQKLDLSKAKFITPASTGDETFTLTLDDTEILSEDITLSMVSKITGLEPIKAAALVQTEFSILLSENQDNLTYIWDFGDNTNIETTDTNQIKHTYTSTGSYSALIIVKSSAGSSSKNFTIKVIPPEEAVLELLAKYKEDLITVKSQIEGLPEWVKTEVNKKLDMQGIEEELNQYEDQYENAFSEESYVNIMKLLLEFKIPSSLTVSQQVPESALFLSEEQLDLKILENLGAGSAEEGEDYNSLINTWLASSLDAYIEFTTYALDYNGIKEDFLSYVKISLIPNDNIEEVYLVINGNPEEIIFSTNQKTKEIGEEAEAVIFDELTETKTIEFLYPGRIDIGNFPGYLSPEFKNLELGITPGICNLNGVCEKNLQENWKNCRNDCKPYLWISVFLIGLVIIFLVVYIILQEWYKRHYETKLFPDKNQLFNLINFMNTSINQGNRKQNIFNSLKELDWSDEQLTYAWNKFNGKRTGMWEIPLFKWVENKQVKAEIEKRQNIPIQKSQPVLERTPSKLRPNLRRLRYR
ncbi:MAG: PKD domain-containing protein, partial [Candidatus Pacearchaeota archaeon]